MTLEDCNTLLETARMIDAGELPNPDWRADIRNAALRSLITQDVGVMPSE